MRILKVQIVLLTLVIGCTSEQSSTTSVVSDNEAASDKAQEASQGASQPLEVTTQEQRMMERFREMYGDRELRAWPNISVASIGQNINSNVVREIIEIDTEVKAVRSESFPEWRYDWSSPSRGHVTIMIAIDNTPITSMITRAGVNLDLVKTGKAEEIDFSKFGAIAIWKPQKGSQDLRVITAHKMIMISSQGLAGSDGKDINGKRDKHVKLAELLFTSHAE